MFYFFSIFLSLEYNSLTYSELQLANQVLFPELADDTIFESFIGCIDFMDVAGAQYVQKNVTGMVDYFGAIRIEFELIHALFMAQAGNPFRGAFQVPQVEAIVCLAACEFM